MRISTPASQIRTRSRDGRQAGVLLEVLLALMLFAAVAAVVTTAFNASVNSLERQKLGAQALNLAASTIAEVQLGIRPANSDGPQAMETPLEDWTWETALTPTESVSGDVTGLSRLEVIIRHQKSPTVQRLAQMVRLPQDGSTNATGSLPQM